MSDNDQPKRVQIPTDAQIVREFIAEAEAFQAALEAEPDQRVALMQQGNLDARYALASRLEYVKAQREALVKEAADKIAESFTEGLRRFTDNLLRAVNGTDAKGTDTE